MMVLLTTMAAESAAMLATVPEPARVLVYRP
jgi:hypothetical protein